jgi:hypothetical protein
MNIHDDDDSRSFVSFRLYNVIFFELEIYKYIYFNLIMCVYDININIMRKLGETKL